MEPIWSLSLNAFANRVRVKVYALPVQLAQELVQPTLGQHRSAGRARVVVWLHELCCVRSVSPVNHYLSRTLS